MIKKYNKPIALKLKEALPTSAAVVVVTFS